MEKKRCKTCNDFYIPFENLTNIGKEMEANNSETESRVKYPLNCVTYF